MESVPISPSFNLYLVGLARLRYKTGLQNRCFASSVESNHQNSHFCRRVRILCLYDPREAVPFLPNRPDNNFETSKSASRFEKKGRKEKDEKNITTLTNRREGDENRQKTYLTAPSRREFQSKLVLRKKKELVWEH